MSILDKFKHKDNSITFYVGDIYMSTYVVREGDIYEISRAIPVDRKRDTILVKFGSSKYYMDLVSAAMPENICDARKLIKKPTQGFNNLLYRDPDHVDASAQYFADNIEEIDPMHSSNFHLVRSFMNNVCPELISNLDEKLQEKIRYDNEIEKIIGLK